MEYQVLARKWRPTTFTDLVGQEQIARTLQNAIELKRIAHAYLFTGVRGVGKTSSARILAKALNCQKGPTASPCNQCEHCLEITAGTYMDVLEIDGASNTGVDDVRELKENIQYLPTKGRYKIYIIDEVHMLSRAAFNALLKTLEEPPAGVVFILATTEPQKLPETILSRCQRFDFKRVAAEILAKHLQKIVTQEGIKLSQPLLHGVAREAQGSVRDALTLLDRLISYCGKEVDEAIARDLLGMIDRNALTQLLTYVCNGAVQEALTWTQKIYHQGYDLKRLLEILLFSFRNANLVKAGLNADQIGITDDEFKELKEIFKDTHEIENEKYFDITKQAYLDLNRFDQEQFLIEATIIKLCRVKAQLVSVVDTLNYLKSGSVAPAKPAMANPSIPQKPNAVTSAPAQPTASTPAHDTIEDPYVKKTVGLFGAKVEKIQIHEE